MDNLESEEGIRSVILRRSGDNGSFGFSIMGGSGYEFPPVIYGIEKDSPAAISGLLEAGDVILSINEREVVKLSTKEVLKCLRLSGDIVHIKYKRDPSVVNRVRQFLSTPNYIEDGGTGDNPQILPAYPISPSKSLLKSPRKGGGGVSQIPVYKYQNQQNNHHQYHQSPRALSPNDSRDQVDHSSVSKHSSFTDELFINHAFQVQPSPTKVNKVHAHIHHLQEVKQAQSPNVSVQQGQKNGQRKNNFETFVMTGDAILNVSSATSDNNGRGRGNSPLKKLTPMPHLPVFVERDKDFNRRIMLEKERNQSQNQKEEKTVEESGGSSEEASPPLPPPPPPLAPAESVSSFSSDPKLPPPPPELESNESKSNSLKNGDGAPVTNGNAKNSSKQNSVNEDTSISSSVMSDDDDEDGEEEEDEDVKKLIPTKTKGRKKSLKRSESSQEQDGEKEANGPKQKEEQVNISEDVGRNATNEEKERYNEYILLNGSRGTLNDDDYSGSYSQAINKAERTPSTITGGGKADQNQNRSPSKSNDSNSEGGDQDEGDSSSASDHSSHSRSEGDDSISSGRDICPPTITHQDSGGISGGDSDSESVRVAPVTKAVDIPSAERLAKRLYQLDGFKCTDVWRHLSKNTDFNRVVAMTYLNFFEFKDETLDISLRKFLAVCPLRGETTDRERILSYFSSRYVESNPDTFGSQDSVHTLACAMMLLNTDMYSGIRGNQKMSCSEFIQNLSGLNDGGDFPRDVLKQLYHSIRENPLVSPSDVDEEDSNKEMLPLGVSPQGSPTNSNTVEYKRGYLVRKSTHEFGGKKTPLGKRSWKMYFCRLQELILVLSPDENSSKSSLQIPIKLHHAFSSIAADYRKKKNVFRLILADRSQFLFQSSDTREMHSWIDMINWNAARFSSPALEAPVSSSRRFERPLFPSGVTKLGRREQVQSHQAALEHWEKELETLIQPPNSNKKSSKASATPNLNTSHLKKEDKERFIFYQYEIKRYRAYLEVLEKRANAEQDAMSNGNGTDHLMQIPDASLQLVELQVLPNPPVLVEEES